LIVRQTRKIWPDQGNFRKNLGDFEKESGNLAGILQRGVLEMLTTIVIGSCVSIQGTFVKRLQSGLVVVRDGDRVFSGRPVANTAA